ncbi:GNAT family N-acetyltransferase [Nostoc commune]|uniref:GNAT family N-acetyltransferase n=1 Tax=Nostoc commune TaxID=1178 RepID=UPI0018C7070D|nr:GNAT family N-acetyltransferase [Nostoc commune]MBG1261240.1 GNAT family N-acetyltransferase [Nostoc commune BAE]
MKLLTIPKIEELPSQEQWNNYTISREGGSEISTIFLASIEQAFSSDFQFNHIAIYDNEELILGCPIYVSSNINLEIILPDNFLNRLIYYWRKLDRSFLLYKVMFIGTPLNDELDIFVKTQEPEKCFQLFTKELARLQKAYNADLIIFKNLIDQSLLKYLNRYGFFGVNSLPNSIINCDFSSYEYFLNSLDARKRRNINSKLRKAKNVGYDVQIKFGNDLDLDNLFILFENSYLKSKYKFERINIGLFRYLIEKLDREIIWINILENNYPVASSCCYIEKNSLVMKRVGIDYSSSIPFIYFILHYETIRYAIQNSLKSIKLGPTAYEAKKEMGASLQSTYLLIKHENLVFNKLLPIFY